MPPPLRAFTVTEESNMNDRHAAHHLAVEPRSPCMFAEKHI